MVDAERVAALLVRLRGEAAYLRRRADGNRQAIRDDEERLSGLKYRFVTALETVINIAQHLCASEGWGPPTSNGHSVLLLGEHGVLETELAGELASAVGFRNVLVHQYDEVDDDRVVANLDDVEDLQRFIRSVASWVDAQGFSGP